MDKKMPNVTLGKFGFEGVMYLSFLGEEKDYDLNIGIPHDEENPIVSYEQIEAYNFLLNNHEKIFSEILELIFLDYPAIREELLDFQDVLPPIPIINTVEEMKENLELSQIHIHTTHKDGISFLGLEFECTWDIEHGLGFMTHKNILLEYGSAEVSFSDEYAEKYL